MKLFHIAVPKGLSHLIANNMQRKTVRIFSFSNSRSKDSYAQNFYTALYNLTLSVLTATPVAILVFTLYLIV